MSTPIGPTTNSYDLTVTPDPFLSTSFAMDPYNWNGLAAWGANWSVVTDSSFLIDDQMTSGYIDNTFNATATQMLTDSWRPGDYNLTSANYSVANYEDICGVTYGSHNTDSSYRASSLDYLDGGYQRFTPTDPLVLDLDGDGVRLTDWLTDPVLFDTDHDGGSQERTGWVSREDGLVVMDINGNGTIDDISETLSEYFAGTVGTGGNAGTKPFANGLAALKSLDSNNDNAFTSADAAWANVKVWQDANHDGVTDSGELKTLGTLGITRINLTQASQSGLISGGNEILASSTFVRNGVTREAVAANFLTDPNGQTGTASGSGRRFTTQGSADADVSRTYVAGAGTAGEFIGLIAKAANNAIGGDGNDSFTGNAASNWLVGGRGSDTFKAGAGNDVLLIDAEDLQANIQGGAGNDIVQVVGDLGVTLNLAQAGTEEAIGGRGDDILIGGGTSTVFIRGGDGDDIVIGGAANDALMGEEGDDLIDGGAGNDLIRGHRGQDNLMGRAGDDVLMGGQEDDRLMGGTGNDILKGDQGDDTLDGGEDTDSAEFTGSYADYRITQLDVTTYRVVDTRAGRDGADILHNIEKLNFADVNQADITLDNPMPVDDDLTIVNRTGARLIKVSDIVANDRDWQGDSLHVTTISEVRGGTIAGTVNPATGELTPTLTANGELTFTPDVSNTGVMSFKYKIADVDGTPGASVHLFGSDTPTEARGQVLIRTPDMPTDELFTDQWYF